MQSVLITASDFQADAQALLRSAGFDLVFLQEPIGEDEIMAALMQRPIQTLLLRGSKPITERVLSCSPHLKLIAKNGVGVDSVDLVAAKKLGIEVRVATGANADAVAEGALSMMLALVRNLSGLTAKVQSGGWEGTAYRGRDFKGSTLGIVGFGEIGQRTAELASALGAHVVVHHLQPAVHKNHRFEIEPSLDALLARADMVSLHCPLTEQTKGLIGARELTLLKPSSYLINTARGALVDEAALIQALRNGALAGAGLDVFEQEPLAVDSALKQLPNVILTPHVAGVTAQAAANVAMVTARAIVQFQALQTP